jgi:hypothetical protein
MSTRQKIALGVGALLLGVTWSCHRAPARTAEQMHWDSVAAGPRWVLALAVLGDTAWFDRESIVRTDSLRYRAWWRRLVGFGPPLTFLSDFNCGARRWRNLRWVEYDSTGKAIFDELAPVTSWKEVRPQSMDEEVLRVLCGFAASRTLPIVKP